jgi:hypothetical protein
MTNKNWMEEEYGVPHKNGHVRFYLIGFQEYVYEYLGWFDMTDWDKGMQKVCQASEKSQHRDEDYQLLRHDQIIDLSQNVQAVLEEALEDKDETTFSWWYKKKNPKEQT